MNRYMKVIAKILLIATCVGLFTGNVKAVEGGYDNSGTTINDVGIGNVLPSEMIEKIFASEVEFGDLEDIQFERIISFEEEKVFVDIVFTTASKNFCLEYTGKLYRSFRYTDDQPVYVGVLEELGEGEEIFEVVYFEISNGDSPYNLRHELRHKPSVTMYIQDGEGNLYDLGSKLSTEIVINSAVEYAAAENDINWFMDVIQGEYKEESVLHPQSIYSNVWSGNLHSLNYRIADYEHSYLATPYIDFVYGDVPNSGSIEFSMSLKISESARYRRVGTTSWTTNTANYARCFIIDNVQLTWTAGGNTAIHKVSPHLNTTNTGNSGFSFVGLAAAVTGISPQTATLSALLTVADSILGLSTGSNAPFTNTVYGGTLSSTRAYKMKMPSNYYISKSGYGKPNVQAERFEYIAIMATSDSSKTRKYKTNAIADFTFKLSWTDITGQSGSKTYTSYKSMEYLNNY